MTQVFTVLAVCTGNVHRSALAGALLEAWAQWYLPPELRGSVVVESAGTQAPAGAPMGSTTRRIAESLGVDGRPHRARSLDEKMVDGADLVLAASRAHRDAVVQRAPRALRRTFTIREAARILSRFPPEPPRSVAEMAAVVAQMGDLRPMATALVASDDDIVDPQGKDVTVMDDMVREELPALVDISVSLWGMPKGDAEAYVRAAASPMGLRLPDL